MLKAAILHIVMGQKNTQINTHTHTHTHTKRLLYAFVVCIGGLITTIMAVSYGDLTEHTSYSVMHVHHTCTFSYSLTYTDVTSYSVCLFVFVYSCYQQTVKRTIL